MNSWEDRKVYVWNCKKRSNFRLRLHLLEFPIKEFAGLGLRFSFLQNQDHLILLGYENKYVTLGNGSDSSIPVDGRNVTYNRVNLN
jgi:hypothetical protein